MKQHGYTLLLLLLPITWVLAQNHDLPHYEFSLLRQNDVIELNNNHDSFYQKMKSMSVKSSNLSFGGSYRGQYEYFYREEFGAEEKGNGWYLQRLFLHSHFRSESGFQVYAELAYSDVFGKENLAPVDINELYFNQLFIDYTKGDWTFGLGRKNLRFGTGRLVDIREGPNVRRLFDGINVEHSSGLYQTNFFYVMPVQHNEGVFDDRFLHNEESLWGFCITRNRSDKGLLYNFYYLGTHYNENEYARGTEEETRHSMGLRINRAADFLNFDNEFVYQFGSFGLENISAWTISFHTWKNIKPFRLGVKTELISGDDGEGNLNTFNALYPRGAYFGRVARFGPANLIDIHPYIQYRKGSFFAEIDYDHFWRFSENDGVYDPPLNAYLTGESDSRHIAGQVGTILSYEFSHHFALEYEANYIMVGDFIRDVRGDVKNLFHTVITGEYKF